MDVRFICVGRLKEGYYLDAQKEYIKRLGSFCKIEVCQVKEEQRSPGISSEAAFTRERDEILRLIPTGAKIWAMCIEGKMLDSVGLSKQLAAANDSGSARLCIIIGGSEGLHPDIKQKADFKLSMSPMTFPHHLARIMALEQLYRAFDILRGGKYHK